MTPAMTTIPEGCPWHDWAIRYGVPNVKYCEETICAWVNEPAYAWSNLAYLLLGLLIWRAARRYPGKSQRVLGLSIIVMGLFSFFYHATNNFLSQSFDYVGMFLYVGTLLSFEIDRTRITTWARAWLPATLIWLPVFLIFHWLGIYIQYTILIAALSIAAVELYVFLKFRKPAPYRDLFLAVIFVAAGEVCSLLDASRIWCSNPQNHILQGHAVWHVLGGVSAWFAFRFYRRVIGQMPSP